ncbi:MAG: hypothetical protein HY927_14035 [Elusimicrobia bacterium]|nr:hypothetical protein [Elusimicrobiota bacterium]
MTLKEDAMNRALLLAAVAALFLHPCQAAAETDIAGRWTHAGGAAAWTFTKDGQGTYRAVEEGLGNARGTAVVVGDRLVIVYATKDKRITGCFDLRLAEDGQAAEGTVEDSRPARAEARLERAQAAARPDILGIWRHSPEATWTISAVSGGSYLAEEKGLGNARGQGRWTSSGTFKIDYKTQDGAIEGIYEVRFSPDGDSASGTYRELTGPQRSGRTSWTKVR